jgi:hypothetical protein
MYAVPRLQRGKGRGAHGGGVRVEGVQVTYVPRCDRRDFSRQHHGVVFAEDLAGDARGRDFLRDARRGSSPR